MREEKKKVRNIKMDEYEMKKVTLTKEQVVLALRSYIKQKVVPPRDAEVKLIFESDIIGKDVGIKRLEGVTISWSDSSFHSL